jgi:hypothetical protein
MERVPMTPRNSDPYAVHIPDHSGRPICGATTGRTSVVALPTCLDCRDRTSPSGMQPRDAFNPAHPVGRIVMGSGFGVPGFPQIPGLWKRFRGG